MTSFERGFIKAAVEAGVPESSASGMLADLNTVGKSWQDMTGAANDLAPDRIPPWGAASLGGLAGGLSGLAAPGVLFGAAGGLAGAAKGAYEERSKPEKDRKYLAGILKNTAGGAGLGLGLGALGGGIHGAYTGYHMADGYNQVKQEMNDLLNSRLKNAH